MFTEGEKTERDYLVHWHRIFRETVNVTVGGKHGAPKTLVEAAAQSKARDVRTAKRGGGRPYDEVWCVFDRDEHDIAGAVDMARSHGIQIAMSNPCIELWFVLHFERQDAHIHRYAVQSRSRELLGCDKALSEAACVEMVEHHQDAVIRAQRLAAKHVGDGSPPQSNPSSDVWKLIQRITS